MRTLFILTLLLNLGACSTMLPASRHEVKISNLQELRDLNKKQAKAVTRQEKYFRCVVSLSREGIKQSLIGELCDKTHGSIND